MTQSAPEIAARRPVIESVQVMRGLAAIAVAIYHTNLILQKPGYGGRDILYTLSSKGWLGVNFFFVLSGFIIMFAHERDIGRPSALPRYVWRRVVRLYPIYWLCLTIYLAAALVGLGYPDFSWRLPNIASAYLLVPLTLDLSLPLRVVWTLFYELAFYAAFAVLIINRALGIAVFTAWFVAIMVFGVLAGEVEMSLFHTWNLTFLFGVFTYLLSKRLDGRHGLPILLAGVALLACMLALGAGDKLAAAQRSPLLVLALAVPFALILLGATLAEPARGWRFPPALMLLGSASYAIYLVHSPVISIMAQVQYKLFGNGLPELVVFWTIAIVSVLAGVVVHLLIEKPMLDSLRRPWTWPGRARRRQGVREA